MNEVTIFKNEQFGEIRTAGTADNPLFCLADICKVLDLRVDGVLPRLKAPWYNRIGVGVQTGRKKDGTPSIQKMNMTFINEMNLYKVIMRSDKPQAEAFQDWVCGEVLPSIRKTGGYLGNVDSMSDEEIMAKALVVAQKTIEKKSIENKVLKEENVRLESENVQLALENQELRHDKNYLDLIMRSKALLTISQIAQDYGMSGKAMNKVLADMGIQYSLNGQWILYAKYKDNGFVSSRSIDIVRADGRPDIVLHTEWTQAGRRFLYEELKKRDIIPMLERA